MKTKLVLGARLLFGTLFIVFGLNGFLQFIPLPAPTPEAGQLLGAFAATGYFFPFVKSVEVIVGVLLVANIFVPLALAMIFPILVGIFQIHIFLDPASIPMGILLVSLHLFLTYNYWNHFRSVVQLRAEL